MARKRKQGGDGTADSPAVTAEPDDDSMGSSAAFSRPVYLVAVREDEQSAYSVIKIDGEPPRARTVAELPGAERGMSFVAAHSEHGSWIVGVGGGLRAGTIVLDPSTLETFHGPRLSYPKHRPVLISHRGVAYAVSRRPRVVPRIDRDPWFESLSFNNGVPSKDCGVWVSWSCLPPPPFFPCLLDPFEFRNPPEISVSSYAAVGSHILLSAQQVLPPQQQQLITGTYAFHVMNKTWEKVDDRNLPFVGQAVPLGSGLFAACPVSSNAAASLFHMSIKVSSSTPVSTPLLSIQEFPVAAVGDKIPAPLFCPLGEGSFGSIRLGSICRSRHKATCLKKVQIILTAFQMENIESVLTACQSQGAEAKDLPVAVQVKEQSHTYKTKGRSHLLASDTPVVAALSM